MYAVVHVDGRRVIAIYRADAAAGLINLLKKVIDLDIYFSLPSVSKHSFIDGNGAYCSYGKLGPATNDTWVTPLTDTRVGNCGPMPKTVMDLFYKMGIETVKIAVQANDRGEYEKADKHALSVALASGLYELKASPEHAAFTKAVKARATKLSKKELATV